MDTSEHQLDPLTNRSHASWDRLIASINPPSMLVALRGMLGRALGNRIEVSDLWQETLLHAWRDRARLEWRGPAAFRRWLLEIARNRVCDLADADGAHKRGRGCEVRQADLAPGAGDSSIAGEHYAGPVVTTTPSRVASDQEIAARLQQALEAVPDEWRDVVRLRLFEDLTMEEVGGRLGLGVEGVRYRFRHGVEVYRGELRRQRVMDSGHC